MLARTVGLLAAGVGWAVRQLFGLLRLLLRWLKLALALPVAVLLNFFLRRSGDVFVLDLRHGLHAEQPGLLQLFKAKRALSLLDMLRAVEVASQDERMSHVLVLLDFFDESPAVVDAVARVLGKLRATRRKVWTYSASYSRSAYLVACAADRIYLAPGGSIELNGVALGAVFIKELLETFGVEAEMEHVGDYKSFSETFTRNEASEPHREMLRDLGKSLYGRFLSTLSRGRKLSFETARALFDHGPFLASEAAAARLIDAPRFGDELDLLMEKELGRKPERVLSQEYLRSHLVQHWYRRLRKPPARLAYVPLEGSILDNDSGRGEVIVPSGVGPLLERLGRDNSVKAVVLYINSPGGSAAASDLLWRSVKQLDAKKPVVVSLGPVAASGGYYIAAAGRRIFAEAGSLTGSIGVVAGKINGARLLRDLGVHREEFRFGRFSGMGSPWRPFNEDELGQLRHSMEACYQMFLERVAVGRRMRVEDVHTIAQGRVFTGARAREIGLVDALGGPAEALEAAAELVAFPSDGVVEMFSPQPRRLPFPATLLGAVRAQLSPPGPVAVAEAVGARLLGGSWGKGMRASWLEALTSVAAQGVRPWALLPCWLEV